MGKLEEKLEKHFGYSSFRTGQKEIIQDVLMGKDVLGILPTGSGKSICYQLPAKILNGTVVVVSPLISLMIDQVKQLRATGFQEVVAINSFLDVSSKKALLNQLNKYKLIYISPEMLQNKKITEQLQQINISLFVIDEAHCISQWGHEFRPDYLKLDQVIRELNSPPVLALSATATPEVQLDIKEQLKCPNMVKHVYPMDRDNIAFAIQRFNHFTEKLDYLVTLLDKFNVPTMIYFSSREWTEKTAKMIKGRLPHIKTAYYHGGMEQGDRILIQQQFMNDQLDVICCTSAFGMGINKRNIRLVIHYHLPTQLESFIQEVGRAGRDGNSSVSLVLLAPNDDFLPQKLIESELPSEDLVSQLVRYLLHAHSKQRINDETIVQLFDMNEIQWRFIRHQLENHGMIKDNQIIHTNNEDQLITEINRFIENRKMYKQNKLFDLLNWTSGKQCRRHGLFHLFQDYIQKPKYFCCDICDFTFDDWKPKTFENRSRTVKWQQLLTEIFLQDVNHAE